MASKYLTANWLGTSSPSTSRRRLNQSEPLLPSLGGRSHTILVVEGSWGFSSRKFQLMGFWHSTLVRSLENITYSKDFVHVQKTKVNFIVRCKLE